MIAVEFGFDGLEIADGVRDGRAEDGGDYRVDEGGSEACDRFGQEEHFGLLSLGAIDVSGNDN